MAENDALEFIVRAKALRGAAKPDTTVQTLPSLDKLPHEQSLGNSANLLKALGYDEETIGNIVKPSLEDYDTMEANSLDSLDVNVEAAKLTQQRRDAGLPVGIGDEQRLASFIAARSKTAVAGMAEARSNWDKFVEATGENFAKAKQTGSTNIDLGLGLLDVFQRIDNWTKYGLAHLLPTEIPPSKMAEIKLQYMPTVRLLDPKITKEFSTGTEASLWITGQKMWGAANTIAAFADEGVAKLLEGMRMPDAAAVMEDLSNRAKTTSKEQANLTQGQIPQLVAGLAPTLSWQTLAESQWDPKDMDDVYKTYDDMGAYGDAAIAAQTIGWAGMDLVGSPAMVIGSIPSKIMSTIPKITKLMTPIKDLTILEETAKRTYDFDRAEQALKSSKDITATAQTAVDNAAKLGSVSADLYKTLIKSKENELRNQAWFDQFMDPGEYEPIMPRTARRNPEFIPDAEVLQYEFRKDAVPTTRKADMMEIASDMQHARKQALVKGPPIVSHWDDGQLDLGTVQQRVLLGPDDTETAGDALNLLVQGATIDDITTLPLAPEYYTQPTVATSLVDIRKITHNNELVKAKLRLAQFAQNELGASYQILVQQEKDAKTALYHAKRVADPAEIDALRAQLKQIKKTKRALADHADTPYDTRWLPPKAKGIMESPERFNRWLEVAGDRVVRSAYPGGLNIRLWHSQFGQGVSPAREPMRYYQAFAPDAWERMRNDTMRFDQALRAGNNLVVRETEASGIVTERLKFDPAKAFSPYQRNKELDGQLFDVLNTHKLDAKFQPMYDALTPALQRNHDRFRDVLDHFADLQGISNTDRYLEGYIRHTWDARTFQNGARPIEMIGLPAKGEVFASHLMKRHGFKGYQRSAVLAMDIYLRSAYRKLILEPMYKDIIQTGLDISKQTGNSTHITYANDLVAGLKGTPSFLGAKIDEAIGGAWNSGGGVKLPFRQDKIKWKPGIIDRTSFGFMSLVHNALLSGNPAYAILQISSGLATTSGKYGPLRTLKAVMQMATKEGQQISQASGTYRPFVDFLELPAMRKINEFFTTKVPAPPLMMTNNMAEAVSRKITFMAELDLRLTKGGFKNIKEASKAGVLKRYLFEALRSSEEVNHMYGPFGRSPWAMRTFGTTQAGAATQLLSYIPKQTEELLAQFTKNPGSIFQYLAASGWILHTAANSGVDLTRAVGLGYVPQSITDITSPAVDAALTNLELMQAMNDNDPDAVQKSSEKLAKLLPLLIPTSQMFLKAGKAAQRYQTGEVQTPSGSKLYNMQMYRKTGEGIGGEMFPTLMLQPNLRETLQRRALEESRAENRRFAYNAHKALDNFVDASEAGDVEAAAKLRDELLNVYKTRLSPEQLQAILEARSLSQAFRDMKGNSKLGDVYYKIYKDNGINVQP